METANETETGFWFDPVRKRWRVRLYLKGSVYHLSYHYEEAEARETYDRMMEQRKTAVPKEKVRIAPADPQELLDALLDLDY